MSKKDDLGFVEDVNHPADAHPRPAVAGDDLGFTESAPEQPKTTKEKIIHALGVLGRGLDYPASAVRVAGAKAYEGATGKKLLSDEEISKGMGVGTGQGIPDSAELMARAGVGSGGHLSDVLPALFEDPSAPGADAWISKPNKGGWMDPSTRGTAGFLMDTATDPLNIVSAGAAGPAKRGAMTLAEKLKWAATLPATAPSRAVRAAGSKLYESALRPIIEAGERKGKDVADVFSRYGVRNMKDVENLQETINKIKAARDQLLAEAGATGATVSRRDAFQPVVDALQEMSTPVALGGTSRITPREARKISRDVLGKYSPGALDPSPALATQWKTDLAEALPGKTWDRLRTQNPTMAKQIQEQAAGSLRGTIEKTVDTALPKRAGELSPLNADYGTMLTALPTAVPYAQAQRARPLMSGLDWLILSGEIPAGMYNMRGVAAGGLAAKKAAEWSRMPTLRMPTGYAMQRAGSSKVLAPTIDFLTRRELINKPRTPDGQENK